MNAITVTEKAIAIIAELAEQYPPSDGPEITAETTFETLNFDSLDRIEIAVRLEDEFGIRLEDDEIAGWTAVADVLASVTQGEPM